MRPFLFLLAIASTFLLAVPVEAGPPQGDTATLSALDRDLAASDARLVAIDQEIARVRSDMDRTLLALNDAPTTGAAPAAAPELPPAVATEVDAAKTGLTAVKERAPGWQFVLAGALLSGVVFAFRRGLLNRWPALRGDGWGWFFGAVLPLLVGACLSLAGKPLGWQTVLDALLTAGTSLLAFSTAAKGIAGKPAPAGA